MADTPPPVTPDEVPEELEAAAVQAFWAARGYSERERVRAAVAAALTAARDDIARRACSQRVLTNEEMAALDTELDRGDCGNPGEVYSRYFERMILSWPGGSGG